MSNTREETNIIINNLELHRLSYSLGGSSRSFAVIVVDLLLLYLYVILIIV